MEQSLNRKYQLKPLTHTTMQCIKWEHLAAFMKNIYPPRLQIAVWACSWVYGNPYCEW